jgi:hypothetical protein
MWLCSGRGNEEEAMLKRPVLAIALLLALGAVGGVLWGPGLLHGAQGGERAVAVKPPPSCAESIAELGLEGQEVHCVEPPSPNYDPPAQHGPFRLIPPGYVGDLTYDETPATAVAKGVVTSDLNLLKLSSLYREPSYMPQGYLLSSADTAGSDSENAIHMVYTGPGPDIEISRLRRHTTPVDVWLPLADGNTTFEATTLGGKPAIVLYPSPGSSLQHILFTRVSFMDGDVETTVVGRGLDVAAALGIASSIETGP